MTCHIVCKTLTTAQRIAKYLNRNNIRANVKRLPSELRENNGCGYAVRLEEKLLSDAIILLENINMRPKLIYQETDSGEYREMPL